ncbi:MAG: hypothetical protein IJW59_02075 [Clostridia bacterium]|nr:hypothetical protein [Clostridia bacterium]
MKSKGKKILAGMGLICVCGGLLGGCSLSKEQQSALDLITSKSDEIIDLLEKNMNLTNSQLSKTEAAEQILIARNKLDFSEFDKLQVEAITEVYSGFFDNKLESYHNTISYKNENNSKSLLVSYKDAKGNLLAEDFTKSDFQNDIHYTMNQYYKDEGSKYFEELEYMSELWDLSRNFDLFAIQDKYTTIEANQIKNIEVLDGGYKFDLYNVLYSTESLAPGEEDFDYVTKVYTQVNIINGCIDKYTSSQIIYKFPKGSLNDFVEDGELIVDIDLILSQLMYGSIEVETRKIEGIFKYDNIDFTEIDAKFAAIEQENNVYNKD